MKKLITLAVILSSIALTGCGERAKIYKCGNESFEVTSEKIVALKDGAVIDKDAELGDGNYKLFSALGFARYNIDGNKVTIRVGAFKHQLTCEVSDK